MQLCRMGRRKRLCMIYSNENEVQEDRTHNEEECETINEDPAQEEDLAQEEECTVFQFSPKINCTNKS